MMEQGQGSLWLVCQPVASVFDFFCNSNSSSGIHRNDDMVLPTTTRYPPGEQQQPHDYNHHNHNDNYNNNENTQNPMKPRLGKQQRRRQQLLLLQELQQQPHTYDNNFAMMSSSSSSSYWTGRPPRWSLLRFPTAEPNAEFLRHSCESISRPSRTFAHRIAQLQATTRISLA
ncbi:hypothetical protein ACA910_017282 [Epithemia clementina (nom. ined.)]